MQNLHHTVSAIQQVTVGFHNMPDSKSWVKTSAHNKSTYIYVYIQYKLWIAIIFWSTCMYIQRKHGLQSLEINNINTDCQWLPTASVQLTYPTKLDFVQSYTAISVERAYDMTIILSTGSSYAMYGYVLHTVSLVMDYRGLCGLIKGSHEVTTLTLVGEGDCWWSSRRDIWFRI